ncbi:hypothetical protein OUZ56_007990 [Daphnia magna]|uniref:Uncharacterized protein n=1 Tax=Daphnia magna TaxID=35525 RepID=A0ABR0ABL4_9CRUS|nr:hypothetical protein OUZ56_007990 [Daphnia magna]
MEEVQMKKEKENQNKKTTHFSMKGCQFVSAPKKVGCYGFRGTGGNNGQMLYYPISQQVGMHPILVIGLGRKMNPPEVSLTNVHCITEQV